MAYMSGFAPRQTLAASLVTVWGIRLTFNFARKGGYSWKFWEGEEDYRWAIVRKNPLFKSEVTLFLFNLFFISLYQTYLIMGFTVPILLTFDEKAPALGTLDYVASGLYLSFWLFETVADEQQWSFQQEKKKQVESGKGLKEPYKTGFIRSGLWSLTRHPNYFAEQSLWLSFYVFSIAATGRFINWTMIGSLLLMLLFRGSADVSEGISASKYPEYKNYQKTVPIFIPKLL